MLVAAAGLHKMFSSGDGRASAYPLLPREWLDSVTLVACSRGRMQYNALKCRLQGHLYVARVPEHCMHGISVRTNARVPGHCRSRHI